MKNRIIQGVMTLFLIITWANASHAQGSQNYLKAIGDTYKTTKVLSFEGNIKYYTSIQNTSPSEIALMVYRRDGDKIHIAIGTQTMIYDGKLNIIVNEDEQTIYLTDRPAEKPKKGLPTEGFDQYAQVNLFDVAAEDYVGNKRKMSIRSKDKALASTVEFIYQPTTNFVEFTRMIVDSEDENLSADINKKKFEFSYYNYKTSLPEKITTSPYVEKVKSGKKTTYKGVGKFKNYQIVTV